MKRTIALLLFIAFSIALLISIILLGPKYEEKIGINVIRVAGDNNFPPYEYMDSNNTYTGFNVDIMNSISLSEGVIIEFIPMPWYEATEKLKSGEIDAIQGMKVTSEREKDFDFSLSYLENSQSIFIRNETKGIDNFDDLSSKRVAIQRGDSITEKLSNLKNVEIVFTENQEQAIISLSKGNVDAFIGNTLSASFFIQRENLRNDIKVTGDIINPTEYAAAVKKGDTDTLLILNRGIRKLKLNGTYEKIYRKWFGQPVNQPIYYIKRILVLTVVISSILLLFIFIFFRWNTTLKKEVARKTSELNDTNEILLEKNKRINEELALRGEMLNLIFSGVIVINSNGTIAFLNNLALNKLYPNNEINYKDIIGKNYRETPLNDILSSDMFPESKGEKLVTLNGKKMYFAYIVSLLNIPGDNSKHNMVVIRDITEEKILQENIRARDKVECLENIMAGIAHEIRNPLTAIKTYVDIIPKKYYDERFMEICTKDLANEVERINALISDLIEYTKPRIPYREKVNLKENIEGILSLLGNIIKKNNINIEFSISEDTYVLFDKNNLRQIIINILINSIESMDKEYKKILITSFKEGDYEKLRIEDNGCGISSEDKMKLFNPFFTTKAKGTGLGLFVTYNLLCENKGNIEYKSSLGYGTIVDISLLRWREG